MYIPNFNSRVKNDFQKWGGGGGVRGFSGNIQFTPLPEYLKKMQIFDGFFFTESSNLLGVGRRFSWDLCIHEYRVHRAECKQEYNPKGGCV